MPAVPQVVSQVRRQRASVVGVLARSTGLIIKCGDGWLVGSWQRRPEFAVIPAMGGVCLDKKFDELAGKRVCDSCHKRYPLARHMFRDWMLLSTAAIAVSESPCKLVTELPLEIRTR